MQPVADKKGRGDRKQAEDFASAQGMFAEDFEDIGEQGDAGAEEDEAEQVERRCVLLAIVGQMEIDQDQAERGRWGC